jgi:hypothetical protein
MTNWMSEFMKARAEMMDAPSANTTPIKSNLPRIDFSKIEPHKGVVTSKTVQK